MSVIALYTAKGAPGATTAAMLISSLWPRRSLLVDCDPAGGDIALRLPGHDGGPLDVSVGMLSLLPMARRQLQPADVLRHAQVALGGGEIVAGLAGPDQAAAAGPVWASLAELFAALPEHDVFLDLGRLHPTAPVLPLARRADIAVCVVQATLAGTIAARARLRTLLPALTDHGPQVGIIVRSASSRTAESAAAVLVQEYPDLQYFGWLTDDRAGAELFEGGRVSRPERTQLVRSSAAVITALDTALQTALGAGLPAAPESRPIAEPVTGGSNGAVNGPVNGSDSAPASAQRAGGGLRRHRRNRTSA